jgi:glycosyltransferase involved in cell wall biosynthesis
MTTGPLVTLGVPVYRGQDRLPGLLECLRTQSYKEIDVLVSVDAGDQATAEACKPFLGQDSRFRMHVQPSRLGWAGNTDWTMRNRRGDFYIYQQHDDLVSPTYVADLVEASARWPNAAVCYSKLQWTGERDLELSVPSLLGPPVERALTYLQRLDWVPLRGLIRSSALARTSGLLISDFAPLVSRGTERRFLAELCLTGEFRFVDGPTYFKSWHGGNMSAGRQSWPREDRIIALAGWAAWMIEVIVPVGRSLRERRRLLKVTLERFAGRKDPLAMRIQLRRVRDWLRGSNGRKASMRERCRLQRPYPEGIKYVSTDERPALLRQIFECLRRGGRFDPGESLNTTWEALESELLGRHKPR